MSIFSKILSKFKKPAPAPDLRSACDKMDQLCEDFDNACFYISNIPGKTYTEDEKLFFQRAGFGLTSARDELKIQLETIRINKIKDFYARPKA